MKAAAVRRNPYIVGRAIADPDLFYGRNSLFAFITDNLEQGSQVILLHGQRRIGKSSVILQIPNFVDPERTHFVFVPFDLHNKAQLSLGSLLHRLAEKIVTSIKLNTPSIIIPTVSDLEAKPTLFSETFLAEVYRALNGKNLVLLLDEFDVLNRIDPASQLAAASTTFFPYLQALLDRHENLFIIPAIGRQLDDMPKFLSLFRNAPRQRVGLLKDANAKQLIIQPAKGALDYTADSVNAILELSGGHPYFTQAICHAVFLQARMQDNWQVRRSDVESVVDDAIEISEGGLAWFWDGLQIPEQVVFTAVAEAQGQSIFNRNVAEVDAKYHQVSHEKIHLHLSSKQIYQSLEYQLLSIEIVSRDSIIIPQDLATLELPTGIESDRGIVLEGRAPNWLYSYLLQALPAMLWIASYDPKYGAVVVSARSQQVQVGQILEIATSVENDGNPVSPLALLREHGVVPIKLFPEALERLVESEFVTLSKNDRTSSSQISSYKVQVELVRRWLIGQHPLNREIWRLEKLNSAAVDLYETALEFHQNGDLKNALDRYQECLEINPNYFSALFTTAEVFLETEVFSKAVELFTRAHQVDATRAQEGFVRSLLDYGRDLIFQGNPGSAKVQLSKALDLDPENREVKALLKLMRSETPSRKVLIFAANPTNSSRLRLEEEIRLIKNSLAQENDYEQFLIRLEWPIQPKELPEILREFRPQIVHYTGHGVSTGELWLEDKSGRVQPLFAENVASLFELFSDNIECAVLNSGYSEMVGHAIAKHINYVICTNTEISNRARIAFSGGFYKALAAGTSIEKAYSFGCAAIHLENCLEEHQSYVLLKKQ